jgi:hypothetical protein
MADSISDGHRRALADSEQVEALQAGGIDHAGQIVDERIEADFRRVPVGHAVGALVVANQAMPIQELAHPVPPQRALPVMLEVVEPIGCLHHRWPVADRRPGQPRAVMRGAIAYGLFGQLG